MTGASVNSTALGDAHGSEVRQSNVSDESLRSSTRSSANQKALNLVRHMIGHRNNDYRTDTPLPPQSLSPAMGPSSHSLGLMSALHREEGAHDGTLGGWRRCIHWPAERRHPKLYSILYSRFWKALVIIFTLVLLFGTQVRFLVIPKDGDTAVDYVFLVTFIFFIVDILMRIDTEPNYFQFSLFGRTWTDRHQQAYAGLTPGCGPCQIGSFLFYCDLLSTLTLLFDISYINKGYFAQNRIQITLDEYGIPTGGLDGVNDAKPVEADFALFVTILQTLRIARFIRSSAAIKISSKINWYLVLNLFNPVSWWNCCCCCFKRGTDEKAPDAPAPIARSIARRTSVRGDYFRRMSWGGVGLGALAAVKGNAKSGDDYMRRHGVVHGFVFSILRTLGLRLNVDEAVRQQLAATKIQRAWRRYQLRKEELEDFEASLREEDDVAWKGRSASNPLERALQKKSFLIRYGSINKNGKLGGVRDLSSTSGAQEGVVVETDPGKTNVTAMYGSKNRNESQVGSAMRELTGQRVAIGIILTLFLTVLFTYTENDATRPSAMVVLHNQTANPDFANKSLDAAVQTSIPDLFSYQFADGSIRQFSIEEWNGGNLRDREILNISIKGIYGTTIGLFAYRKECKEEAVVSLLSTFFILLVWFFGVTAFAGPVLILVVIPIERMDRLLEMLMLDPLGYQETSRYKRFVAEEDELTKNTRWTKEVLKGMETSFLMSTILRIGSLMKVGFGSAGVEIIRNNLKGQNKNMLMLSSQGSTVSCIFLFCDIRQFTDATECLQEEVFVFTNRIAAVVHSICHSYGGSANKNVGDAFLLSWPLEEEASPASDDFGGDVRSGETFSAKHNQADKALLSVVKICMALHYDEYYLESMSTAARDALLSKLSRRKGPVVQMGFGLHAGKAVQGAIGSQRKIDATYVSEAVERAEFLESLTKKYGLKMLMSDSFHRLLHPSNRRRCRKIDQILIRDEDDESDEDYLNGDIMELLTFDMDIDALWREGIKKGAKSAKSDAGRETDSEMGSEKGSKREVLRMASSTRQISGGMIKTARRRSTRHGIREPGSDEMSDNGFLGGQSTSQPDGGDGEPGRPPELVLPTGPALYNSNVWVSAEMRQIRQLYSDGLFFQKFNSGLQSYYAKDWDHAKQCFATILDRFEDGPSRYFLTEIERHHGKPPREFLGYGTA